MKVVFLLMSALLFQNAFAQNSESKAETIQPTQKSEDLIHACQMDAMSHVISKYQKEYKKSVRSLPKDLRQFGPASNIRSTVLSTPTSDQTGLVSQFTYLVKFNPLAWKTDGPEIKTSLPEVTYIVSMNAVSGKTNCEFLNSMVVSKTPAQLTKTKSLGVTANVTE